MVGWSSAHSSRSCLLELSGMSFLQASNQPRAGYWFITLCAVSAYDRVHCTEAFARIPEPCGWPRHATAHACRARRCQAEGSKNGGILLPHRLVDELTRVAEERKKPELMGGDFARLAQTCQEVRGRGAPDLVAPGPRGFVRRDVY